MPPASDDPREIRIPRETVNDDVVTVQSWAVAHGEQVTAGQHVVDIETSKSVLELEAETDGYLHHLHPAGAEVPVGELVGRVEAEAPAADAASASSPAPVASAPSSGDVAISRKAQVLIDKHGIDPSVFAGKGLIRERDVRAYMESSPEDSSEDGSISIEPLEESPAPAVNTSPVQATPAKPYQGKGLFGDAKASAGDRGTSTVVLIWNYFWRNWLLGNLVKVAPRGVINVLHRWRGVKMGPDCFIDPTSILETAYPENITMGKDVRVTVGCIIMTHIKAPHHLRDTGMMPAVVKPVILQDHCFIGVNSVVMPGVTVGRCSVVASGSVVMNNVPPYTMVSGNPAKVVKQFPKPEGEA
ncbi:MAG: hypothetical protein MK089_09915 [Phycisphaerales bacterium]|nr:hypothetical protein [Phycisphaerales bacterium]